MARLIFQDRKSPVLSRPSLPCISMHYTINLTAGCVCRCKYCYAQGFRRNLPEGRIVFYHNSYKKLTREFRRKKSLPQIVFFSTACEPFAPFSPVLDETYKIMEFLLSWSVSIYLSTKGYIPDRFIKLYSRFPGKVFAQVGLTTVDDRTRKRFEPHAAPVAARLNNIRRLLDAGVSTEARMDPLIPEVNDGDESLQRLFARMKELGLGQAVASYLFLRNSNTKPMVQALKGTGIKLNGYYSNKIDKYCSGGSIEIVYEAYRESKYRTMVSMAAGNGVALKLCSCKNPGLTENICHPKGQVKT